MLVAVLFLSLGLTVSAKHLEGSAVNWPAVVNLIDEISTATGAGFDAVIDEGKRANFQLEAKYDAYLISKKAEALSIVMEAKSEALESTLTHASLMRHVMTLKELVNKMLEDMKEVLSKLPSASAENIIKAIGMSDSKIFANAHKIHDYFHGKQE